MSHSACTWLADYCAKVSITFRKNTGTPLDGSEDIGQGQIRLFNKFCMIECYG